MRQKTSISTWTFWTMLIVLLLAAYLRIHNLNQQGLWGDEGWSIWLARGDTPRDLTMTMVADHHGPIYSWLLRAWDLAAGNTVLALRMITVLFSIASIALLYRLGRALFNPAAGVFAALAFTLMDKHVVLTQEVRDYPMVYFMMIGIALFYVRWRRNPGGGNGFGFVAFTVLALYLHYYAYMVNIAILIHAVLTLRDRRSWRHFIALNGLIALAFFPWTFIVIHQFVNTPVNAEVLTIHGMPLDKHTLHYLTTESLGTPVALYGLLMLVGTVGPLIRTPGSMSRIHPTRRIFGMLVAALWVAVPLMITLGLHSRYPLLTDRNISVIMPGIALLVGFGLTAFERFSRVWIVALVVINGLGTTSAFFVKPPWKQMAPDIAARYADGDIMLVDVEGDHAALWYHMMLALPGYDINATVNRLPSEDPADETIYSLYYLRRADQGNFIPHLQSILARTDGIWLGYWGDEAKRHDIFDVLELAGFVRTDTMNYAHHGHPIYAYRYDRLSTLQNPIVSYGDSISLRRVDVAASVESGDDLNVHLWWGAESQPPQDYTVSVFLLDSTGRLRAQHDSYPDDGQRPTTGWTPGGIVFDTHTLHIPDDLPAGDYNVCVKLYTWWDGAILRTSEDSDYQIVGTVSVE